MRNDCPKGIANPQNCTAKVQLYFKLPKLFLTFCINTLKREDSFYSTRG